MTTVRARELISALAKGRAASSPELKQALLGVASEARDRLASGSKESHDFFLAVSESIQEIRGAAHLRVRVECLFACCQYFYRSGHTLLAILPAKEMVSLARRTGDPGEVRRAHNTLGILCADTGDFGNAIEQYAAAIGSAQESHDPAGEAAVWLNLGVAMAYTSRYQEALSCLERARELLPPGPEASSLRAKITHNVAVCYFALGDLETALRYSEQAVAVDDPRTGAGYLSALAHEHHYIEALLELSRYDVARHRLKIARQYSARADTIRATEMYRIMEGLVEAHCGDVSRGIALLEDLVVSLSRRDLVSNLQDALRALTKAYERGGRTEKALSCLQEMLRVCSKTRQESVVAHIAIAGSEQSVSHKSRVDLAELHRRQADLKARLALDQLNLAQMEVLERLAITADLREDPSGRHGFRVGRIASLMATALGWRDSESCALERAARLHDIGKLGIPERIVLSTDPLQLSERNLMAAHASIGAELLSQSNLDQLRLAEEIARCHHEWWNGSGYPRQLRGKSIPISARVVALADVFDALTHGRTYESPWSAERALDYIRGQKGAQFDPELTESFISLMSHLIQSHESLDEYLGEGSNSSGVLKARDRIQAMLASAAGGNSRFDLATSKS